MRKSKHIIAIIIVICILGAALLSMHLLDRTNITETPIVEPSAVPADSAEVSKDTASFETLLKENLEIVQEKYDRRKKRQVWTLGRGQTIIVYLLQAQRFIEKHNGTILQMKQLHNRSVFQAAELDLIKPDGDSLKLELQVSENIFKDNASILSIAFQVGDPSPRIFKELTPKVIKKIPPDDLRKLLEKSGKKSKEEERQRQLRDIYTKAIQELHPKAARELSAELLKEISPKALENLSGDETRKIYLQVVKELCLRRIREQTQEMIQDLNQLGFEYDLMISPFGQNEYALFQNEDFHQLEGAEVILWLTMESSRLNKSHNKYRPLRIHHTEDQIETVINDAIAAYPQAKGIATRYGEQAMEHKHLLQAILRPIEDKNLWFLDITANKQSKLDEVCNNTKITCKKITPYNPENSALQDYIKQKNREATRSGLAAMILPLNKETINYAKEISQKAKKQGTNIVKFSTFISY